jgi:tetraacyldisaccharide-1-P 4'-kinase
VSAHDLARRLWDGPGFGWGCVRAALLPASALYGSAVAARNAAYAVRLLRPRIVPARTVSVGNLRSRAGSRWRRAHAACRSRS